MSPAMKSKSRDKSSTKLVREQQQQQKTPSKVLTLPVNGGSSAYNPISGTFHSLESNGRYPTAEDQSGSSSGTPQYDTVSNHDSCSGESEDLKEKGGAGVATSRPETVPGSDTDKREKIRQKNEKKHQRQKERRAQELHERCTRCLMSRKLETLAQQLVAMGFPSDRATMALLVNGGRVEESVAWLFDGEGEDQPPASVDDRSNMKIDISDELAKIAELEVRFKCSKQDVERIVVACEGDMDKTAETLKTQKQEPHVAALSLPPSSKGEQAGDLPVANVGVNKVVLPTSQSSVSKTQVKVIVGSAAPLQQKRDDRDFNYTKSVGTAPISIDSGGNRSMQPLRRPQTKAEWARPQEVTVADKRWPNTSSSSAVSYSLSPSPLQVAVPPSAKAEARYAVVSTEVKANLQTGGTLREPVIVMQRPQSNARQSPPSACVVGLSPPPAATSGWYPNGLSNLEMMKAATAGGLGPNVHGVSLSASSPSPTLQYRHSQYQPFASGPIDAAAVTAGLGGRWSAGSSSLGTTSPSSSLAVPSSLGLFTGWGSSGSSGSSSPVDWSSTGSLMMQCDYASIDWSLDSAPMRPKLGSSAKNDRLWATTFMGTKMARPGINGGVCLAGLQEGGGIAIEQTASTGSHEWTSPFAGKDIFSLSRQFVTSPSL